MEALKLSSLNVRGLGEVLKRKEIFNWHRSKKLSICMLQEVHDRTQAGSTVKAGFHMIADRRSQIADRNKVCDRLRSYGNTSAIVCDPAIVIADDRRR